MIPKIIHYCWLSNDPVPEELQRYMKSWKKYLPDYEFIKWDFSRFDINSSIWVKEAFENKKYAFAADYIRMYALYTMGGIYLDMDVEVLKPYDDLLNYNYFMCYENSEHKVPEVAAFGTCKGSEWVNKILQYYNNRHFVNDDGSLQMTPLPLVAKNVLSDNGVVFKEIQSAGDYSNINEKELAILPCDFFSPKSYTTGKLKITNNTYSIHRFSGSWLPWEQRIEHRLWQALRLKPHRIMFHVDKLLGRIGFKR